jgi:hypothetical protein
MIADIEEDPFIPVAFQKAHSGMQGTEYFEGSEAEWCKGQWELGLEVAWRRAKQMNEGGITKQLINRILEPYQWYTCICTFTEGGNFFNLRCPQYEFKIHDKGELVETKVYKSRKDVIADVGDLIDPEVGRMSQQSDLDWLKKNKGQGEIHISLLAEAMWDSMNEYDYKQLKAGEWHIPFGDRFDDERIIEECKGLFRSTEGSMIYLPELKRKIATARCARVSYNNFEGKDDYEADIKLYDRLKDMGHMSPFEHCARTMSEDEYLHHSHTWLSEDGLTQEESMGWSGNFRGFVQLRKEI